MLHSLSWRLKPLCAVPSAVLGDCLPTNQPSWLMHLEPSVGLSVRLDGGGFVLHHAMRSRAGQVLIRMAITPPCLISDQISGCSIACFRYPVKLRSKFLRVRPATMERAVSPAHDHRCGITSESGGRDRQPLCLPAIGWGTE